MQRRRRTLAVLALLTFPVLLAGDWPQFRGPDAGGRGSGLTVEPVEIGMRLEWRRPLGSGYSSVIVAEGKVITQFADGTSERLAAYDARSGEPIWSHVVEPMYAGHDGSHDGSLATPLLHGDHVYAVSPAGKVVAVGKDDGKPRWSVDLVAEHELAAPFYGFSGSPIAVGDVVVVQAGAGNGSIFGFAAADGKLRWRAGTDNMQYPTPAVVSLGGRPVVVAVGNTRLWGVDPSDGSVLFEHEHGGGGGGYGAASATPVAAGEGRVFVSHRGGASAMYAIGKGESGYTVETLWENNAIRHSYGIPVYHDGHIYGHSSRFLTCLDAETGEATWKSRQPGDGYTILVDDYLVVLTREGTLHLIETDPERYDEIASVKAFEELAWSPPSFANDRIYGRSLGELASVRIASNAARTVSTRQAAPHPAGSAFGAFVEKLEAMEDAAARAAAARAFIDEQEAFPVVEDGWVHFVYHGDVDDVAVGSDLFGIASELPLRRVEGTDLFHGSVPLANDTRANYVLFVDFEETLDPRNPRTTRSQVIGPDLELSFSGTWHEMSWFAMPAWQPPAFLAESAEADRGSLVERTMASEALDGDVALKLWLPPGYDDGDARYPVLYLHGSDGAIDDGGWVRALDNLVGESVAPLIAVFLPSMRVAPPAYDAMFVGELVPWVDENLRTIPERDARATVGQNFGAITALVTAFSHPDLIGRSGAQSGFFTEFAWAPLRPALEALERDDFTVYVDWGRHDLRSDHENWDLSEANAALADALRGRGMTVTGGEAPDGSGWSSWRNRTDALLTALFPAGG